MASTRFARTLSSTPIHRLLGTAFVVALCLLITTGATANGAPSGQPVGTPPGQQQNGDVPDGSQPVGGEANWKLAARFAPYNMRDLTYSTSIQPRWIEGTDNFWYRYEASGGADFILVEPTAGRKRRIRAGDQEEDRAVVEHLEYPFGPVPGERVVEDGCQGRPNTTPVARDMTKAKAST